MSLKSHKKTLYKDKDKNNNQKKNKEKFVSPLKDYVYVDNGKKKVVAYLRVSTKSESQATSLEQNQPALIESMFKQKEIKDKYELLAYYPEWSTGTKIIRPVFKTLLADAGLEIEKEEIDTYPDPTNPDKKVPKYVLSLKIKTVSKFDEIWVKNTSRFARNIHIVPVLTFLKHNKVIVRFLDLNMDTEKDEIDLINDKISIDMKYSQNLSKNIKASKKFAIERGEPPLYDTFGYFHEPISKTSRGRLIENKKEADIVRFIYDVYLNGFNGEQYGTSRLAKLLAMDIPELGKKPMLTRKGKPFAHSTIYNILTNETYTSYKKHGKYSNEENNLFDLDRKVKVNHNVKMKKDDRIDVIIDLETWEKVQNKLKFGNENIEDKDVAKKKNKSKRKPLNPGRNKYSKYLVCGFCQNNFRHDYNKGNPYYSCATKEDKGVAACNVSNVYTDQLDELINRYAKHDFNELYKIDIANKAETLLNYVERIMLSYKEPNDIEKIIDLKKKLRIEEEKLDVLVRATSGNEDIKSIQNSISYITANIVNLNNELKELNATRAENDTIIQKTIDAVKKIIEHYESIQTEYTEKEILEKLDKIVVNSERNTTGNKRPNPVLIPYFKYTNDKNVEKFIKDLDFEIPKITYQLVSGIEYYDTIDTFINDKKLNEKLKEYLKGFNTIEEAKEHSKNDLSLSDELKTYLAYFDDFEEALDTIENALSNSKIKFSPYDKDIRLKDLIKPYNKNIPIVTLNYSMEDLNRKHGEKVITFNEHRNLVETVGYSYNLGVNYPLSDDITTPQEKQNLTNLEYFSPDPIETIKIRLNTIESAFKTLQRQFKEE